jgi:hypothetical protein
MIGKRVIIESNEKNVRRKVDEPTCPIRCISFYYLRSVLEVILINFQEKTVGKNTQREMQKERDKSHPHHIYIFICWIDT